MFCWRLCTQKLQQEVRPPTSVQTFSLWVYSHLCFLWFCFIFYFFVVAGVVYFFLKLNIHIVERGQQQTDQYILYCSTSPATLVDNKILKSVIVVVVDADDFLFSFASINLHIKLRMYNMLSYILLRGVCVCEPELFCPSLSTFYFCHISNSLFSSREFFWWEGICQTEREYHVVDTTTYRVEEKCTLLLLEYVVNQACRMINIYLFSTDFQVISFSNKMLYVFCNPTQNCLFKKKWWGFLFSYKKLYP